MVPLVTVLCTVFGVLTLGVILSTLHVFDKIVRNLYDHDRQTWENVGSPQGFFWRSQGVSFFAGLTGTKQLFNVLAVKTPNWAKANDGTYRLVRKYHLHMTIFNVIGVTMMFALLGVLLYTIRNLG